MVPLAAFAQGLAHLVKDINALPDPYSDSSPTSLVAVGIALETLPSAACSAADPNHDQKVTVNELASAVDEALKVCDR